MALKSVHLIVNRCSLIVAIKLYLSPLSLEMIIITLAHPHPLAVNIHVHENQHLHGLNLLRLPVLNTD